MDVKVLMSLVNGKYGWNYDLKPEQQNIIENILSGRNVIGVLPTGYGKSLTYTLPPLMLDEADPEHAPHIAIVVSPLRSLMHDQVDRCYQLGIKSAMLTKHDEMTRDTIDMVKDGKATLVFTSHEALQAGDWLKILKQQRKQVCLVAYDEVHCLSEWGADFRPDYIKSVQLRSIFSCSPCLGLSATVTEKILTDIKDKMEFDDKQVCVVSIPPDRPNIFLEVVHKASYDFETDLLWLVKELEEKKEHFSKTIIFAQTVRQVVDIYEFVKTTLGEHAYCSEERTIVSRLISMYHGQIAEALQNFTLETFRKPDSSLRLLICTIAFGMGVEVRDIHQVVHWGKSQSILSHWQEIGRCGRDGTPSKAIWYPKSTIGEDKEIFDQIKTDKTTCIRQVILNAFRLPGMDTTSIEALGEKKTCDKACENCKCPSCTCCTHCKSKCPCN